MGDRRAPAGPRIQGEAEGGRSEFVCLGCGYRVAARRPPTLCPECRRSVWHADVELRPEDQALGAERDVFDPLDLVSRDGSLGEALRGVPFN